MPSKVNLETTIVSLEKSFGKGIVMPMSASRAAIEVPVISTGCPQIDALTVIGGVPRGRITEIYGPEGSGKSTLAEQVIAQAQQEGRAAYIDMEQAMRVEYAADLGVDVDNLLISQPDCGEDALTITEELIKSGEIAVIVVDSVSALVPRKELDGEMGDPQMGLQARLMSQAMRKLAGVVARTQTALIFINQVRSKLGVMYGNPETTSGGRALKFYASIRISLHMIGKEQHQVKGERVVTGQTVRVEVVKNKFASPYRRAEVLLEYGHGFLAEEA